MPRIISEIGSNILEITVGIKKQIKLAIEYKLFIGYNKVKKSKKKPRQQGCCLGLQKNRRVMWLTATFWPEFCRERESRGCKIRTKKRQNIGS